LRGPAPRRRGRCRLGFWGASGAASSSRSPWLMMGGYADPRQVSSGGNGDEFLFLCIELALENPAQQSFSSAQLCWAYV
jgi:hypothetical protein